MSEQPDAPEDERAEKPHSVPSRVSRHIESFVSTLRWVLPSLAAAFLAGGLAVWAYGEYRQKPVESIPRTKAEPPAARPRVPERFIRVLSLDGGGILMLPALQTLADLETRSGRPVWQLFDLIVGTGSGAAIAAALTVPENGETARFTATKLVAEFPELWRKICDVPEVHPLLSMEGRTAPRLLTRDRQRALGDFFGEARLGEALTTVVLAAFHLEDSAPFFFASDMGQSTNSASGSSRPVTEAGDFFLADAVLAATGDPSVFAPVRLRTLQGEAAGTFVGAGLFAFDPALIAVNEALLRFPGRQCVVISLGVRATAPPATGWSAVASPQGLARLAAEGSSATVAQTAGALHRFGSGALAGYVRFEAVLPAGLNDPYDASRVQVEALLAAGRKHIEERAAALDRTASFLATP